MDDGYCRISKKTIPAIKKSQMEFAFRLAQQGGGLTAQGLVALSSNRSFFARFRFVNLYGAAVQILIIH